MSFHPIFVTWFLVVFGDQVTKILHNSLLTFFTEQGKTGKNRTHGNENLTTYFWYFGSFDEVTKMCNEPGISQQRRMEMVEIRNDIHIS